MVDWKRVEELNKKNREADGEVENADKGLGKMFLQVGIVLAIIVLLGWWQDNSDEKNFKYREAMSTLIIAEIGLNHNGNMEVAKCLIDEAYNAGADIAKFQFFDISEFFGPEFEWYEECMKANANIRVIKKLVEKKQANVLLKTKAPYDEPGLKASQLARDNDHDEIANYLEEKEEE